MIDDDELIRDLIIYSYSFLDGNIDEKTPTELSTEEFIRFCEKYEDEE